MWKEEAVRTSPDDVTTPGARTAVLPKGARLVVRPVSRHDVEGLAALYAGLDDESRYRRFFSMYRPDRTFFERLAHIEERGGGGVVAVVIDHPDRDGRVVAEASYEPLENGDGELAIVVDSRWRGWLGPYLLDALLERAASRGVPNLEADVLASNRPMLGLISRRGNVRLPTGDWTYVRAMFSTDGAMPSWPGPHDRLRLLVEGSGTQWHAGEAAREAGISVLTCAGPARNPRCPLLSGGACPLVDGADVVVITHPTRDQAWAELRARHIARGTPPVCVETGSAAGPPLPGETIIGPPGEARVLDVVEEVGRPRTDGDR
jgi:acetyltransferase